MTRNVLARAALTSVALVVLVFPAAVVVGGYVPSLPTVGRFGAFLATDLPVIALAALGAVVLAALAIAIGGGRFTRLLAAGALVVVAGIVAAGVQLAALAGDHGAVYQPLRQLTPASAPRAADRRVVFATVEGQPLQADLWLPPPGAPTADPTGRPALVFVHGGAFVEGKLGSRAGLFAVTAAAGYPVLDIEYRLAPPPRWHDAPADVLCALVWLAGEASNLGIDPSRVVLMGESAGGSLALVTGYAAGTDAIEPSCAGTPIVPAGVIAVAPAADLAGIWADQTLWYGDRPFPEAYVGGPPSAYPDRYAAASPFALLRSGLPPTIVIGAANDHLVRLARVTSIVDALRAAGVETTFIAVPFADHGFDGPPDGFGAQLEESLVPAFLAITAPAA